MDICMGYKRFSPERGRVVAPGNEMERCPISRYSVCDPFSDRGYDPQDEFASPYKFHPVNSYCHAWSYTPVYFIWKYPEIFIR